MARVDVCPKNLTEIIEAGKRLKCGNDEFGNNNYICVPKTDKTSLVEFCYNGIMGLQEKGHCLQAFKKNLTLSSCLKFSSGCPEKPYRSSEFYKYPACQTLDIEHRCYLSDPSCPGKIDENINENRDIHSIVGGLTALVIFICIAIFMIRFLLKRRRRNQNRDICNQSWTEGHRGESYTSEKQNEELVELINKNTHVAEANHSEDIIVDPSQNAYLNEEGFIKKYYKRRENETARDNFIGEKSIDHKSVVASIDFGTTYSGYAYGFRDQLAKDLTNIYYSGWSSSNLVLTKAPTTVLLDREEQFVDFGYDAEAKYATLIEKKSHEDYLYFHRFKMMLLNKREWTIDTKISDIRGREVNAVTVVSHAIRYLKEKLFQSLRDTIDGVQGEDILWVLTVPLIWDEKAKIFMQTAAEVAGIPNNQLIFALEAEAAFLWCQHHNVEKPGSKPRNKYFVLDVGGGTVNITVHEVNGHVVSLNSAGDVAWGGISVDTAFKNALTEIVTDEVMEGYCQKYARDSFDLFRNFEIEKRRSEIDLPLYSIPVPHTFIAECTKMLGKDITTLTDKSRFKNHFTWKKDRLVIDKPTFEGFFQPACNKIINHVKMLFESLKVKDIETIIMVGGFMEPRFLENTFRQAFYPHEVIVPREGGLAILRGAVVFGDSRLRALSRIAKYTYGVAITENFDPEKHMKSKKTVVNGVEYCKDVFDPLVHVGEELFVDEVESKTRYVALTLEQRDANINFYCSEEQRPKYIDSRSCRKLGKLSVHLPEGTDEDRSLTLKIKFCGTEITAEAINEKTKSVTDCVLGCIGE